LCEFDYVIESEENIQDEFSIIFIKHTTVFETYAQLAIFRAQAYVMKHQLL
jgi:hypothetical protein